MRHGSVRAAPARGRALRVFWARGWECSLGVSGPCGLLFVQCPIDMFKWEACLSNGMDIPCMGPPICFGHGHWTLVASAVRWAGRSVMSSGSVGSHSRPSEQFVQHSEGPVKGLLSIYTGDHFYKLASHFTSPHDMHSQRIELNFDRVRFSPCAALSEVISS